MSQKTYDDCDRICPYCGHRYQVDGEDASEDVREEECVECGKVYHAYDSYRVTHYAVPDCELNGEQHEWPISALPFCVKCDKYRGETDAEAK